MNGYAQNYLGGSVQQRYGGGSPGVGCPIITTTMVCTIGVDTAAGVGAGAPGCKDVMWTAGCTFAGQQAAVADCGNVLTTLVCTLGAPQAAPSPKGAVDCVQIAMSFGCTFQGGQGVGKQAAGYGAACGNVLTTLACTLDTQAPAAGDAMCVTLVTARPTWCVPVPAGVGSDAQAADCKHVMWTAGCTFAGQQQNAVGCAELVTTTLCTLAGAQPAEALDCGNVLTTLACTLGDEQTGALGAAPGCKDVLWTAGCTFQAAESVADCGHVLTTLACTLVAVPEENVTATDCKHVMWTAGCTFAGQPQAPEVELDCKHVMWSAGCTF